MIAHIKTRTETLTVDLSKPLDISLPLQASDKNPIAWYLDAPKIVPVSSGDWVAKVSEGASVNFNTIRFNPHAHGTHTECVGHITKEFYSVNALLKTFFFTAQIISVIPIQQGDDYVITQNQLEKALQASNTEAVVIRTLPNLDLKKHKNYNHTNWAYLDEEAALFLQKKGVYHLLIDTPSIDKEKDDGKLVAHKAFWDYPKNPRLKATITEFVFVPDTIKDGRYLLNLMIAPFCNDASPSKPVLYTIKD